MNIKWLRIKNEWVPVDKIKRIVVEEGIFCCRVVLEVQHRYYILSTFRKYEEAEEYVRQLLEVMNQQDIIETGKIQIGTEKIQNV